MKFNVGPVLYSDSGNFKEVFAWLLLRKSEILLA